MDRETYTYSKGGKTWKLYGCAKRGCDAVNPDWWAFGAGKKVYCLNHIPLWAKIKLWWLEHG